MQDVGVVIVAAGSSTRTKGEELKQFRWIAGKPMLLHSVQTFQRREDVTAVVVVLPHRYAGDPPPWLFQCDTDRLLLSVGGSERSGSVRNGLEDLTDDARFVLVHDAARPFVDESTIDAVVREARAGRGAVPAIPVVDTLKRVGSDNIVLATVSRTGLWRAQTPQGFPRELLEAAHAEAVARGIGSTDDASLCEQLGYPVVVVPGSAAAIKITTEDDFVAAEALAKLRQ